MARNRHAGIIVKPQWIWIVEASVYQIKFVRSQIRWRRFKRLRRSIDQHNVLAIIERVQLLDRELDFKRLFGLGNGDQRVLVRIGEYPFDHLGGQYVDAVQIIMRTHQAIRFTNFGRG